MGRGKQGKTAGVVSRSAASTQTEAPEIEAVEVDAGELDLDALLIEEHLGAEDADYAYGESGVEDFELENLTGSRVS